MLSSCCWLLLGALLLLSVAAPRADCASLPSEQLDGVPTEEDAAPRRLSKRQVVNINHPSRDSIRHMGLDPYEERLLIILLSSCIAVVFALVVVVICCRTYSLDRKSIGGGGGGGWSFQPMLSAGPGQVAYPGQVGPGGSRQAYYPTGYQPSVQMDAAYLDPTKAGALSIVGHPQQQQYRQPPHQMMVDNTVYG